MSNNSTGAPAACGGSKDVTFTATSSCSATPVSITKTFSVIAAPNLVLNCPTDRTEAICQTQAQINTKFNAWLALASVTGGCNATVSNNALAAPSACGGSVNVTFTATSLCGTSTTCMRTFTVTNATTPVLNCPAPMSVGPNLTQSQINAAFQTWLASATITGGCPGALTNDNLGAPSVCGGATTVTFTYTSPCSALPITCSQTFTVTALPPAIIASKYFAGIEPASSGTPGHFDVITEIVLQNAGSSSLNNLSVIDNLGNPSNFGSAFMAVTQAPQIINVGATGITTTATTLPTVNAAYNGTGDLLTGGGLLEPDQRVVIRFRIEINPNSPGAPAVLGNQATVAGTVTNCFPPSVVNDLTDAGPNPRTSNAGWPGDTGGTNDRSLLQRCWDELDEGMACNDLVQVSLNQNCEIWLTPTMVLEGESSICTNPTYFPLGYYYQVFMVTDAWDVPVPDLNPATPNVYEISGSYKGQTLTVKIKDKVYGNSCWGFILVEDKTAPVFTCPTAPIVVACTADLSSIPAPVAVDNCDPNPVIALLGQQTIDNNICDGTYVIRRIYKATDNQGNATLANCNQTINVIRPPIDFPDDITWSCTQYASRPNIINATALHSSITDIDPAQPGINVSPNLTQAVLMATGSGNVNVANNSTCAYNVLNSDQTVATCGTSFKIIRTWTVVDWCTGAIITTGVGGEDNIQIINVMDNAAPNITRPPFQVSANIQAVHPNPCRSMGLLLPPTVLTDDCSNTITLQINTPVGPAIMNPDKSGVIPAPGLPLGTHSITYIATDACNNSRSITVAVTVVDDISPTTVCNGVIDVNLPSTPGATATVLANQFDNGSTDNCCLHHFEVRRMTDPCDDGHNDTQFGASVVFCCEDVAGPPVMVVVRAFDCHGNYNDCMVEVDVNDKLAPVVASCPANQRITCDEFVDNYEVGLNLAATQAAKSQFLDAAFGQPVFADNCNSATVNRSFNNNLTQCKEGIITRTWTATDAGGLTSPACTQQIFVDHVSDFAVSFPADLTVNCGQSLPNFGQPTIFKETCEMIAVTFDDGPFEVVPGACYKVVRTWQVVNWCVQGASLDQEVVEVPESALGLPFPQCDVDGDGDCDSRTFRDSWTATQRPTAANATVQFGPDTDPDSDPWDGVIVYKQTVHVVDGVAPVITNCTVPIVCIDGPTCSANFTIPMPTVTDCSSQLTVTATTAGLGNGFGPFNSGPGTFTTVFTANDGCGNSTSCSATLTIRDCKAPSATCNTGITVPLMPGTPPMVPVNASQLNAGSTDNCTSNLIFSFTPDPSTTSQVFLCEDEGVNPVQIYVTDAAGNQSFCSTTVTILDNTTSCMDDTLVVSVGGFILNEDNEPVGNVSVNLSGQSFGSANTLADGGFTFTSVPVGHDVSIVPTHDVNPLQGVSTYDLVLISQHILNMTMLDSPYKLIAADVNNSKTVTTFDLVELRKLILLMNNDFSNNTSWRFVERSYQFPDPSNPWLETFPEFININNLPNDVLNADFVAVKIGDVNNSSAISGDNTEDRDGQALVFQTQERILEAGETYEVSFNAEDFKTAGYQFTLEFNPALVEFFEVGDGKASEANFGFTKLDENAITASWNQYGENAVDERPYFTLVFKAKQAGRMSESMWLSDRFTRTEAYNREGMSQQVRLLFLENEVASGFELFQNRPNPFYNETLISFILPVAGEATLSIVDASGRLVKTVNGQYQKGYNEVRIQREELGFAAGILYYRLSSGTQTASKMMLLTH
ncbi:MAG: T9SS type A sorting domain-containing protein [Saprospiraceae bacterium]|nr:T9SS type A sorting domain-containing protein [Saprospiraceae bacterium]